MFRQRWAESVRSSFVIGTVVAAIALLIEPAGQGAERTIDLDGNPTNGEESRIVTRVLQSYPVEVENVIFNNATGDAFTFRWPGAGPGGFDSIVVAGPDVGTKWEWSTVSQVYSIESPVTFRASRGLPVLGSRPGSGVLMPNREPGIFMVPGKSIFPTQVTVSGASLTSSLVTFFSPEKTVALCGGDFLLGVAKTTAHNVSDQAVTYTQKQSDGCCLEPHQLNCADGCRSYLTDDQNCGGCGVACVTGEFCDQGTCASICDPDELYCIDKCVDPLTNRQNCGGCGHACQFTEFCDQGVCSPLCTPPEVYCAGQCVDVANDPANCGACNRPCAAGLVCVGGACTSGDAASSILAEPPRRAGRVSERTPLARQRSADDEELVRERNLRESVTAERTPVARATIVEEAPLCDFQPLERVLQPGESFTVCQTGPIAGKEVFTTATIRMGDQTVGQGPCAQVIPDPDVVVGEALFSPTAVVLNDESGDGLCQPCETCSMLISVQNLGTSAFTNPIATVSSPPDAFNPDPVSWISNVSAYPDFPAFIGAGDCDTPPQLDPKTNFVEFEFTLPCTQPPDVGRVFNVQFEGNSGTDSTVDMPLVIGVGSACDPLTDLDGETYDRLEGFLSPVSAALVPAGSPPNLSPRTFNLGSTVPLKLRAACGSHVFGPDDYAVNPKIVGLTHQVLGAWSLEGLNDATGANPNDPFFTCSTARCEFQLRTEQLVSGIFIITVEMPDTRRFEAAVEFP